MMKRKKLTLLLLLAVLLGIFAVIIVIIIGTNRKSKLVFESNKEALVFVDGVQVGVTPVEYETNLRQVSFQYRLQNMDSNNSTPTPYGDTLSLTPRTKSIVRHNFGDDLNTSSTQVMQLVPYRPFGKRIIVTSDPTNSDVFNQGVYLGSTPLLLEAKNDKYELEVRSLGFVSQVISLSPQLGYDLLFHANLAVQIEEPVNEQKKFVVVKKNPLGFVRVRLSPSPYADEVARVESGKEYELLGLTDEDRWTHIQLNEGQSGWILTSALEFLD